MEFPDDVLGLIRDFSKPLMQFSDKYNKCIHELNLARRMIGVKEVVKRRLCDNDAHLVIQAFVDYVDALLTTYSVRQLLNVEPFDQDRLTSCERSDIKEQLTLCADIQYDKTIHLLDLLYLDKNQYYDYEKNHATFQRFEFRCLY
jgi:hypothetical protein